MNLEECKARLCGMFPGSEEIKLFYLQDREVVVVTEGTVSSSVTISRGILMLENGALRMDYNKALSKDKGLISVVKRIRKLTEKFPIIVRYSSSGKDGIIMKYTWTDVNSETVWDSQVLDTEEECLRNARQKGVKGSILIKVLRDTNISSVSKCIMSCVDEVFGISEQEPCLYDVLDTYFVSLD